MRHHRQAEQHRERNKGRKPHHLPQHRQLPFTFVAQSYEHRLVHLPQHIPHEQEALRTPLVGLVIVARVRLAVIVSQQQVHHIIIQLREYRRQHNPEAEGEDFLKRGKYSRKEERGRRNEITLEGVFPS